MSRVILLSDGSHADLHTVDGCHKYVKRFLEDHGAESDVFSALGMMFSHKTNHLHYFFKKLEDKSFDLRCENVPTGGDDYDTIWVVYSHWMENPRLRIEGQGATPFAALADAFGV